MPSNTPQYQRSYYLLNKERIRQYKKEHYQKNAEKLILRQREYRAKKKAERIALRSAAALSASLRGVPGPHKRRSRNKSSLSGIEVISDREHGAVMPQAPRSVSSQPGGLDEQELFIGETSLGAEDTIR